MTIGEWWEDHDNLVLTAWWMSENGYDAKDLAYFIEKPWKYEDEYTSAKVVNEMARSLGLDPDDIGEPDDERGHQFGH